MKPTDFKKGDRVILARRHPTHNLCGFADHVLGKGAVIEGKAIAPEFAGEQSYIVRMKHPISGRMISPTFIGSMFDRYQGDVKPTIVRPN